MKFNLQITEWTLKIEKWKIIHRPPGVRVELGFVYNEQKCMAFTMFSMAVR